MTLPFERTRAMLDVQLFLRELADPGLIPRVPPALCGKAASLLKHFSTNADMEQARQVLPECFGPVPPFRTRAELADELAPTPNPPEGIGGRAETEKGGSLPDGKPGGIPPKTGAKNGD